MAGLGGPPHGVEPGQLAVAADEGRGRSGRARGVDQPPVHRLRLRRRPHAQLALQRGAAHVVGQHRPGPVAAGHVPVHEPAVGLLAERVETPLPLRELDPRSQVAALFAQGGEPAQRVDLAVAQPLPLDAQPVVVAALQQVPGVERDGLPQPRLVRRVDQRLELLDVEPARGVRPPPDRPGGDVQVAIGIGQAAAQRVQQVPQVGAGLRLGGVRPEQERDPLAGRRRGPVQQQVRQQRLGPPRLQRRHTGLSEAQLEPAEQPSPRHRFHTAECRGRWPPGPVIGAAVRVTGGRRPGSAGCRCSTGRTRRSRCR